MSARQLPVSPDVRHVKHEAKHLLRAYRAGDSAALADFREFMSKDIDAASAKLSDAQLVLARSYGATSFPQLIAAVEFILACWSNDGNRVREAVLAHAEILKDYYKTPHDGWRDDLRAAGMRGNGIAIKSMRESGALIADAQKRQQHSLEWVRILRVLSKIGHPFSHAPTSPIVIRASRGPLADAQPEVKEDVRNTTQPTEVWTSENEATWLRVEQNMKERAQDPTKINRTFERMRAHNAQFPAESASSPELRRRQEWMNECLRLYIQSHPLP